MKKIFSLFLMAVLLVGTFSFLVSAQEDDEFEIPEARKVGFFEGYKDKMKLAFTFNGEKRIDLILEMAEKRLAEAEATAEENPERAVKAQEAYDRLVQRAQDVTEKMESRAQNANESMDEMERIARIQNKFERHRDHADEIYLRTLERFEANNASDEKIQRFEEFHSRAINKSEVMEGRMLEKRENAQNKYKVLSEMTDEELEDLLEKIEENQGLSKAREMRDERHEVRFERMSEVNEERMEHMKERLENSNLTDEEILEIENKFAEFKGRIEDVREDKMEGKELPRADVLMEGKKMSGERIDAVKAELAERQS